MKFSHANSLKQQQLHNNFTLDFGYSYTGKINYIHKYKNKKSHFLFIHDGEIPEDLAALNQMQKIDHDGKPVYYFSMEIDDSGMVEIKNIDETDLAPKLKLMRQQQELYRNIFSNVIAPISSSIPSSEEITVDKLSEIIANKKFCFFTGAGVLAQIIPDWNGLMHLMGYDRTRSDEVNLRATFDTIKTPEGRQLMMKQLHKTHQAFINGKPSEAHMAIAKIALHTNQPVLTDNIDLVHQNSYVDSIHVNHILKIFKPHVEIDLTKIDFLLVCGMGDDRRGFVKSLREKNPAVQLVNINLNNSLGRRNKVEFFLRGDVQEILPQLAQKVTTSIEALDLATPSETVKTKQHFSKKLSSTFREI